MWRVSHGFACLALCAALLTVGSSFIRTEPAEAGICSASCYGIAVWSSTPTFDGALAYINTTQLSIGDQCAQFATSELWVGTAYDTSMTQWVEEGAVHGIHQNFSCGSGYEWFWASQINGSYVEHYPSGYPVTLGTTYVTKIQYQGTGSIAYAPYRNGNLVGTVGTACCTKWLEVGGESNTTSVHASGDASALQKQLTDGTWTYDWGGATLFSTPSGPWTASWVTPSKELAYHAP